jgi:hypothetical protein
MKAAFLPSINSKWEIREIQTPKPSSNQVLIKLMLVDYVIQISILQKGNYLYHSIFHLFLVMSQQAR